MAKIRMERTHHSLIIDGVHEDEQTLSVAQPFLTFFAGNMGIGTWLMGILVAQIGLSFADSIFAIFLGSAVGAVLLGMLATMGPKMRLSQMEMGRYSLGENGKRIPSFLNWLGAVGWDAVNNIFSAAALVSLFGYYNIAAPLWLVLAVLVLIEMVIGIYGHHLIQDTAKYTSVILGVFFVLVGLVAMRTAPALPTVGIHFAPKDLFGAFTLLVFFNVAGWGPYMSDYTRYLPKSLRKRTVFSSLFLSVFLSTIILALFGYATSSLVSDASPEGIMTSLQSISGHFAPVVLLLIGFSAIPPNAMNDNTAAYSLISAGVKLSRPVAAIFGAVIGYGVCLLADNSFIDFFENFLSLFTHWIAPWSAILLVHFFVVTRKEQKIPSGLTAGCIVFVLTSALSILLFSANSLYTGLLSSTVGGIDIGPYIGFVVAGAVYYATLKFRPAKR